MSNKEKLLNILREKTSINPSNYKLDENEFLKIEASLKISNVHFHKKNGAYQIQFQPTADEKALVIELFVTIFSNFSNDDPSLYRMKLEKDNYINENFPSLNKVDISLKKEDNTYTVVYFA